jgi:uncharacterized membrane protein
MSNMLSFLFLFIIALSIGVFIGSSFCSFSSEKISLEEKLIAFSSQLINWKNNSWMINYFWKATRK